MSGKKLLVAMPIPAKMKLRRLSETVMKQLKEDENFAAMVALYTQLLLEQNRECSSEETAYQTELYRCTAKMIEQGQREKSMVSGSAMKLADYYWGVFICIH